MYTTLYTVMYTTMYTVMYTTLSTVWLTVPCTIFYTGTKVAGLVGLIPQDAFGTL